MYARLSRTNRSPHRRPAPHRQEGAEVQRQRQEPRCRVRSTDVASSSRRSAARRRRSPGRPTPSRSAHCRAPTGAPAPGILQRCARTARGPRRVADGVFDVPQQILGAARPSPVAALVRERERARKRGARVPSSPCVYSIAAAPRALSIRQRRKDGRFRICSYHRRPSAAWPRITQKNIRTPGDVGCFGGRPRSMSHARAPR